MTQIGQLTIEGREVGAASFAFGAIGVEHLPEGLSWDDVAELEPGDQLEVTLRFVYNKPGGEIKVDRDNGVESGVTRKVFGLTPIREGLKVNAISKRAEREAAWRASQGASA